MARKLFVIMYLAIITLEYRHAWAADDPLVTRPTLTLPGDGKVKRGSSVVLQCRLPTTADSPHTSIVWYRRVGDVQHQLGVENMVSAEFGTDSRHRPRLVITRNTLTDHVVSNLTIADTYLEDSGEIICGSSLTSAAAKTLSVCADVDSSLCSCMQKVGVRWPSQCLTEFYSYNGGVSAKEAVIGLGIALGCVLLFAIVMSIVASRDCIRQRWQICCPRSKSIRRLHADASGITVLGRSPYNDSDMTQLEGSDSSSDATASYSATCSSSSDNITVSTDSSHRPLASSPARTKVDGSPSMHVELTSGGRAVTVRADIEHSAAARCGYNYAYHDDEDDTSPEHHRRQRDPRLQTADDFDDLPCYRDAVDADESVERDWRPRRTTNEPLSLISGRLTSNPQTYRDRTAGAPSVYHTADVHVSLNDTCV